MRDFTDEEKDIIKLLVKTKKACDLRELQFARILRKRLDCLGIKWEISNKSKLTIYTQHAKSNNGKEILIKSFFDICDFLYFIEELLEYKYIEIQNVEVADSCKSFSVLYDKDNWNYDEAQEKFISKNSEKIIDGLSFDWEDVFLDQDKQILFNDIVKKLARYSTAIIYPLPVAVDYVKHRCKSIPRRQRLMDVWIGVIGVVAAAAAVIVSALKNDKVVCDHVPESNYYKAPVLLIDSSINQPVDTINDTIRVFHNVIIESEIKPQSYK